MASRSYRWLNPEFETYVRKWGPTLGFQSNRLWKDFVQEFQVDASRDQFFMFARRIQGGSHVIPPSGQRDLASEILRIRQPKGCLITSDYQIPFFDPPWVEFVFELATAYGVEAHVMNGDVFDFHSLSRFDGQLTKYGATLEDELDLGEQILSASARRFSTFLDLGNHEWRLYRRLLNAQIAPERFLRLFETDAVTLSAFSYVIIDDPILGQIRVTHPRNYSQVKTTVATRLAEKFHSHIVAGHGHGIGMARDRSGRFVCIDSGGMFKPSTMDYIMTVDGTNPMMNQGAVILTPGHQLILLDPLNLDRDYALWVAKRGRAFKREAEVVAA